MSYGADHLSWGECLFGFLYITYSVRTPPGARLIAVFPSTAKTGLTINRTLLRDHLYFV